jgi:hypothetical protein
MITLLSSLRKESGISPKQAAVMAAPKSGRIYLKDFRTGKILGIMEIDKREAASQLDKIYSEQWIQYKRDRIAYLQQAADSSLGGSQSLSTPPEPPQHPLENQVIYFNLKDRSVIFYKKMTKEMTEAYYILDPKLYSLDDEGKVVRSTFATELSAALTEKDIVQVLEERLDVFGNSPIKYPDGTSISLPKIFYEILSQEEIDELRLLSDSLQEVDHVFATNTARGVPFYMYSTQAVFKKLVDGVVLKAAELQKGPSQGRMPFESIYTTEFSRFLITRDYSDKYRSLAEKVKKEIEEISRLRPEDAPKVPHVNERFKLMPHQAYTLAVLDHSDTGIISVATGGGKTGIIACDCINFIHKGRAHRPLIVMPTQNHLVEQQKAQIEEIVTDGKVNVIGITSKSFRQLGANAQDRYINLSKFINEAPPNTILITTYEWLRSYNDNDIIREILKSEQKHQCERSFWLIKECGVDMVTLDESGSHRRHSRVGARPHRAGDQEVQP